MPTVGVGGRKQGRRGERVLTFQGFNSGFDFWSKRGDRYR